MFPVRCCLQPFEMKCSSIMRQSVLLLVVLAVGPTWHAVQGTRAESTAARRFGLHLLQDLPVFQPLSPVNPGAVSNPPGSASLRMALATPDVSPNPVIGNNSTLGDAGSPSGNAATNNTAVNSSSPPLPTAPGSNASPAAQGLQLPAPTLAASSNNSRVNNATATEPTRPAVPVNSWANSPPATSPGALQESGSNNASPNATKAPVRTFGEALPRFPYLIKPQGKTAGNQPPAGAVSSNPTPTPAPAPAPSPSRSPSPVANDSAPTGMNVSASLPPGTSPQVPNTTVLVPGTPAPSPLNSTASPSPQLPPTGPPGSPLPDPTLSPSPSPESSPSPNPQSLRPTPVATSSPDPAPSPSPNPPPSPSPSPAPGASLSPVPGPAQGSPSPAPNPTPSPSPNEIVIDIPQPSPDASPSPSPPSPVPGPVDQGKRQPDGPNSPKPEPTPSPKPTSPMPEPAPSPKPPSPVPTSPEPPSPVPSPEPSPKPPIVTPGPPSPEPAVIAGAVVGAAAGLALLAGTAGLIAYRRRRKFAKQPRNRLDKMLCLPEPEPRALPILSSKDSSTGPDGALMPAGMVRTSSLQQAKHRKAGASTSIAPVSDTHMSPDIITAGGVLRGGALSQGFTGDELQAAISELKYILTNVLLPAVIKEDKPLAADPFAAWLDFGMDRVRTSGSSSVRDYTTSDSFVEDWRTHRIWDWLNHHFWRHIPMDRRMVQVQGVPDSVPQKQYARHVLSHVQQDWHYQPFADAVDSAVGILISTAVAAAASMARLPPLAAAAGDNGSSRIYSLAGAGGGGYYPDVQYGGSSGAGPAGGAAEADVYYRPVLRQLCLAALKLHLQVQGTIEGMFIYVPSATDAAGVAVPPEGLVCKSRRGGSMQCCLCERPGILKADQHAGTVPEVWVAAYAIKIVYA